MMDTFGGVPCERSPVTEASAERTRVVFRARLATEEERKRRAEEAIQSAVGVLLDTEDSIRYLKERLEELQ